MRSVPVGRNTTVSNSTPSGGGRRNTGGGGNFTDGVTGNTVVSISGPAPQGRGGRVAPGPGGGGNSSGGGGQSSASPPVPRVRRPSAVVALGLSWRRQRSVHAITDYEDLSDSCNQVIFTNFFFKNEFWFSAETGRCQLTEVCVHIEFFLFLSRQNVRATFCQISRNNKELPTWLA